MTGLSRGCVRAPPAGYIANSVVVSVQAVVGVAVQQRCRKDRQNQTGAFIESFSHLSVSTNHVEFALELS
jgi:hypothetical protein